MKQRKDPILFRPLSCAARTPASLTGSGGGSQLKHLSIRSALQHLCFCTGGLTLRPFQISVWSSGEPHRHDSQAPYRGNFRSKPMNAASGYLHMVSGPCRGSDVLSRKFIGSTYAASHGQRPGQLCVWPHSDFCPEYLHARMSDLQTMKLTFSTLDQVIPMPGSRLRRRGFHQC